MVITAATIVIMKMPSPLLHSTDTSYVIAIMILTRNLGQLTYLLQNSLSGNSKTLVCIAITFLFNVMPVLHHPPRPPSPARGSWRAACMYVCRTCVRCSVSLSRLLRGIAVSVLQLTNLCIWIWLVDDTQFVTSSSSSGGVANVVKVCYQGKYSFSSFSSPLSRFFPLSSISS